VRAGDMLLEEVRGGVAKMYEADGLGSVRGLLDATGATTDTWSYTAFGETLSQSGTDGNPYQFAGERLVDSVGMYQNRARWLDTRTGRFVSVDPAEGNQQEPTTFQPYLYGANAPTTLTDPTGEDAEYTLAGLVVTGVVLVGLEGTSWAAPAKGMQKARAVGGKILVLIGYEGPNLTRPESGKPFWHPTTASRTWVRLVKGGVTSLLRSLTQDEWAWDTSLASTASFRNLTEFKAAIGVGQYDRVVVYSHGWPGGLQPIIDNDTSTITSSALGESLKNGGVRRGLILGCNSKELAEAAASAAGDTVRIGGIEYDRDDYVDERKTKLDILRPLIWGYGAQP
jgi:RHS repeat-associated protein